MVKDLTVAEWIAPRLTGQLGSVTTIVPSGYQGYVRICHPAVTKDGSRAEWSEVARVTGGKPHAVMQWHSLVGSRDWLNMSGSLWKGDNPVRGNLDAGKLAVLSGQLAKHTSTPDDCYFCLWDGYGDLEHYGWIEDDELVSQGAGRELHTFTLAERETRRLHLPHRDYLVLTGPLSTACRIGHGIDRKWFWPQSPNIFWPMDRAWCVVSDIDFDSTLVGGSVELIDAILQTPTLDAWWVQAEDSLAADADMINVWPSLPPPTGSEDRGA